MRVKAQEGDTPLIVVEAYHAERARQGNRERR